jgi:hypothetical protein
MALENDDTKVKISINKFYRLPEKQSSYRNIPNVLVPEIYGLYTRNVNNPTAFKTTVLHSLFITILKVP